MFAVFHGGGFTDNHPLVRNFRQAVWANRNLLAPSGNKAGPAFSEQSETTTENSFGDLDVFMSFGSPMALHLEGWVNRRADSDDDRIPPGKSRQAFLISLSWDDENWKYVLGPGDTILDLIKKQVSAPWSEAKTVEVIGKFLQGVTPAGLNKHVEL